MLQNQSKICFVCHPYTARKDIGAGGDRYAYEVIKHYRATGGESVVIEAGINRSLVSAALAELPFTLKMLQTKATLYHAMASASGASALRFGKHPLVTSVHDLVSLHADKKNDALWKFIYKKRAILRSCELSERVIVPFSSTAHELIDDLKVPQSKLRIVPYGIDETQFFPGPKPKNTKRKVLFIGALNRGKGTDTLVESWKIVGAKVPDAELHLCSKGWDTATIKAMVRDNPYKDRILLRGFVPEEKLRDEYLSADVSVFPSRYGFGLPTLESMACGTATVSGRTLDAPEFVGDAGLLANPDDPEELAHQLIRVLDDASLREDLQKRGLQNSSTYRWSETARKTFEVYKELQ